MSPRIESVARKEIMERRRFTDDRWETLRGAVAASLLGRDDWHDACVYVTGSMARAEAYQDSDLDLFVIDELPENTLAGEPRYTSRLNRMRSAALWAALDSVRAQAGFRPFSRGGYFLEMHSLREMREGVGTPLDDATNRFTARMLLLMNSQPLVNPTAHGRARDDILDLYWRDCQDPNAPFLCIFMFNDIRRLWQTMCLNYEQQFPPQRVENMSISGARRRTANLKLRTARMLACYTPILGIIASSEYLGVTRASAREVLDATPLERLERIVAETSSRRVRELGNEVIDRYGEYLIFMRSTKDELHRKVSNNSIWRPAKENAYALGDGVAALLQAVGRERLLYRYAII